VESLLTQTLIVHIIRTQRIPFLQSRASKPMLFATLSIMMVGMWLPFSSLGKFLGFTPLPASYFAWLAGFLVAYGVLTHSVKLWFIRRFGSD
jgi:P-type Mg2+ transporter